MKAIMKSNEKQGFNIEDIEEPEIKSGDEVKLKILKSSICGTDMHIYEWDDWAKNTIKTPQVTGHEVIAEIVEIGNNVKEFKVGDVVVCETHLYCGTCFQCRTGNAHICENGIILGVTRDGIWSEYQVVPQNILWNVDEINPRYAAIMEPLGNAIHTLSYSDIRGKHVLVIGAGPIGIMTCYLAKISGAATVSISEINDYRINLLNSMEIGVNIINPIEDDVDKKINEITKGHGVDLVCEMSGNKNGLKTACNVVKPGGEINILSVYPQEEQILPLNKLTFKNIKIQTLNGRKLFETWHVATEFLKFNVLQESVLDKLITHEFDYQDYEKAMKIMQKGECGKIVLNFHK